MKELLLTGIGKNEVRVGKDCYSGAAEKQSDYLTY